MVADLFELYDDARTYKPLKNSDKFFFSVALRPNVGHGLLILEVSRSHNYDTPHSVGILWTSDQLVAETST